MPFDTDYKKEVYEYAKSIIYTKLEKAGKPIPDGIPPVYVIYARKSTKGKKKKKDGREVERQERSIKDQVKDCQELAKEKEIKPVRIFKEEKSARKSANREVFEEMMDGIRAKKYTGIICWHPDRLGRNMKDAGEIIDLIDRGVIKDLKFPQFTFQCDPNGLMTLGLQFLLAKAYSDNLSINVSRGNRNILTEGKAIDTKNIKGYTIINKHHRPDGRNFDLIKQAFQLAIEGKTVVYIANYLRQEGFSVNSGKKAVSPQDVSKILANPSYTGYYIYGKNLVDLTKLDNLFTPAVSYFDFLRLRNLMGKKKGFKPTKDKSTPILDKMVICGHCGNLMTTYLNKNKKDSPITYLRITCTNKDCETHFTRGLREIRAKVIFEYMYKILSAGIGIDEKAYNKYLTDAKDSLIISAKQLESKQRSISKQLSDLKQQLEDQKSLLVKASGKSIDEANEKIDQIRSEMDILDTKLTEVKSKRIDTQALIKEKIMSYADFLNFFENIVSTLKTNTNQLATDAIIRMIFLNFTIKDKKVLTHQYNPEFETIAKLPSIIKSRRDRT